MSTTYCWEQVFTGSTLHTTPVMAANNGRCFLTDTTSLDLYDHNTLTYTPNFTSWPGSGSGSISIGIWFGGTDLLYQALAVPTGMATCDIDLYTVDVHTGAYTLVSTQSFAFAATSVSNTIGDPAGTTWVVTQSTNYNLYSGSIGGTLTNSGTSLGSTGLAQGVFLVLSSDLTVWSMIVQASGDLNEWTIGGGSPFGFFSVGASTDITPAGFDTVLVNPATDGQNFELYETSTGLIDHFAYSGGTPPWFSEGLLVFGSNLDQAINEFFVLDAATVPHILYRAFQCTPPSGMVTGCSAMVAVAGEMYT